MLRPLQSVLRVLQTALSVGLCGVLVAGAPDRALAQDDSLVTRGKVAVSGRQVPYLIRHLPVSSFPELPGAVAHELGARQCSIPQTYQAHHPENVVAASLERTGSRDWAVLCATSGRVTLLVFLASAAANKPLEMAAHGELDRLQPMNASGDLGFDWGIDAVTPEQMHEAEAGMSHRPPELDHDGLADSIVDRTTVYHLLRNGVWEDVDVD